MNKSDIFWQTYLNLEKEAIELSKYVFFTDEVLINHGGQSMTQPCNTQLETFSPYIADLLVRCCVQIEAISKELYFDNGGAKQRGDSNLFFDEDCLKLIDVKWNTHKKVVLVVAPFFNFTREENKVLKPLKEAHKRKGTYWERAYQAVKHDRYSSLAQGNVKAFLHALAALYLLNLYYKKQSWTTKYQEVNNINYSVGSALFTVKPPALDQLIDNNTPIDSDSPYVVKYSDADFQKMNDIRNSEYQALNDYWKQQPELGEEDFMRQLERAKKRERDNPTDRVIYIWELSQYRLNKKIPKELPFEERKNRLINSEEWNGWVHLHNKHLSADELTEDNIQTEIDNVGRLYGIDIEKRYVKMQWITMALNENICKVYIPD